MDKPFFRLVGAPCGQHGQYTFYKALRVTGRRERIIAIGDFFFVRIWQDSELVSIGELQLLWTDRVSDQTLVSLRLYFLPENTPEGRNQHGEDEVLAINDKVVVRAEDLMSWMSEGEGWRWGLRAVWRGACAPPAEPRHTQPLHHTRLDFSDVEKEKSAIAQDADCPGVVVFSYPRYCRYRALLSRLEGIQADWLRDSLVAALGGYAAPTNNTRILYCKDTFEYPELETHEFVCSHLAPRLKGRPRGRRRRPASRSSRSSDSDVRLSATDLQTPRRLSLRNGAPDKLSEDEEEEKEEEKAEETQEDRDFITHLKQFYKDRNEPFKGNTLKDLSLRALYCGVATLGGYAAVCRRRLWRALATHAPAAARRRYERFLLPFENHERKNGNTFKINGKLEEPQTIDTIDVTDSPLRDVDDAPQLPDKRLRTPSPKREHKLTIDSETGEYKEDINLVSKPAEELNREFLDSLQKEEGVKISVKPVEKLLEPREGDAARGSLDFGQKLMVDVDARLVKEAGAPAECVNGHAPPPGPALPNQQKSSRPAGRSSLRAVRVKPTRPPPHTPPALSVSRGDSSCSPPGGAPPAHPTPPAHPPLATLSALPPPTTINNFGIHHPPPHRNQHSDDEIVEVPYKPKTPEIIDLDEYPESPQAVKKKKLDILKERGLEVTALPPAALPHPAWPQASAPPVFLNPALQHQILTQAQMIGAYTLPPYAVAPLPPAPPRPPPPPRVLQATCTFGNSGPQKTVYGNPKDPFMPPPHLLQGAPIKPARAPPAHPHPHPHHVLDLTCKSDSPPPARPSPAHSAPAPAPAPAPPAVEIVRVTAQNLSNKNYGAMDGNTRVGPNLEITLVNKAPAKGRPPQKRSSNGKFVSAKTPTPPKEFPSPAPSPSPSPSPKPKKPPIVVPTYQLSDSASPPAAGSRDLSQKALLMDMHKAMPMTSFMDPYVALYSSLAGQMDHRQLAVYRDLMATQFRGYGNLLNISTPTTKN